MLCVAGLFLVSLSVLAPPSLAEPSVDPAAGSPPAPFAGSVYLQIAKPPAEPALDAEAAAGLPPEAAFSPLPPEVLAALSPHTLDYESFTATYVPAGELEAFQDLLNAHGLGFHVEQERPVSLPWHRFRPGTAEPRSPAMPDELPAPRAVPGLYLAQFAYPVKAEWLAALEECGASLVANFEVRTLLLRAGSREAVESCSPAPYLAWVGDFLTTDRISPELLARGSRDRYLLQFAPGTDVRAKAAEIAPALALDHPELLDEARPFLSVRGDLAAIRALVSGDPDLLGIVEAGSAGPSGERQGHIVARIPIGSSNKTTHYLDWLNNRGLLSPSNQQIVAVHDLGYDDGSGATPGVLDHHPDMENPERVVAAQKFGAITGTADSGTGHGTMVAGIIAGDGMAGASAGGGGKDSLGYYYGSGIAPKASLVVAAMTGTSVQECFYQERAMPYSFSQGARIANHSWNDFFNDLNTGWLYAIPAYNDLSECFDRMVIDTDPSVAGEQPMTTVFSASNYAWPNYPLGSIRYDTVSSPANAKNVIAVGATESYKPFAKAEDPPLDCRPGDSVFDGYEGDSEYDMDIARVARFSGRGRYFAPYPSAQAAHNVRVKPDLVAPGVRVFSIVPYQFAGYPGTGNHAASACVNYYPANTYYSYGSGTSFAAPVVSGVAALKRKWFLDRGTDPSPSLVKAALIATADSLGGQAGNDHRPSPVSGWGRVNLNRATDWAQRFYVKDNAGLAVATGQQRSWTRTVGNPALPTLIVLVWSDPPSGLVSHSQAPLVNDLQLKVTGAGTYVGNSFNENLTGVDNGFSYRYFFAPFLNDTMNTVEAVFLPANTFTTGQQLTIQVTGMNVTQGPQKFAVYAYNLQPTS